MTKTVLDCRLNESDKESRQKNYNTKANPTTTKDKEIIGTKLWLRKLTVSIRCTIMEEMNRR